MDWQMQDQLYWFLQNWIWKSSGGVMAHRLPIVMSLTSYIHSQIDDWSNSSILAEFHHTVED